PVLLLAAHRLDGLDRIGDVGEVDKGATLLTKRIHELNLAELGEVLAKALLGPRLVEVADVHVPGGTSADGKSNRRGQSTRVLAPADLQPPVVDHEPLEVAESVERGSSRGVDKGNEADVLVGNVPDVVQQ